MRFIAAALVALTLSATAGAGAQVLTKTDGDLVPMTPAVMAGRINDRAAEIIRTYPAGTTAARTAQINIIPPDGADEHRQLRGNAIVLIAAVTHGAEELPLKRVYIRMPDGRDLNLKQLSRSTQPMVAGSPGQTLYGDYREDSLYLAPLNLIYGNGTIMADFTVNRQDFKIYELPIPIPDYWKSSMESGGDPTFGDITAFLRRYYPGYAQ